MKWTSVNASLSAALHKADELGVAVSVSILDADGTLLAAARSDTAAPYTAAVAEGKAYTVLFMDRPSGEVAELAAARPAFFGALSRLGRMPLVPSPGGIRIGSGAIGVSGAPRPDLDVTIGECAVIAWREAAEEDRAPAP